jgi:AcrR family transcriptional regulator
MGALQPTKKKAAEQEILAETATAQRIVSAARRHFLSHGFRGVTMDDLAEELGMSKKTLYASFASKADLLRAVLLDKFRSIETELEGITAASTNVLDSLHQLLACVQRHAEEIQPPFVRDLRREAPEMFQLVQSRRREVIQRYFGKIFDDGRRAGIFRKDISTRLMIEILLGVTEAIMNPPKMAELGLTPKTGFLTIITVVLEGVLTEKGRPGERQGERETRRQGEKETPKIQRSRDKEIWRQGDKKTAGIQESETKRRGDKETGGNRGGR